MTQKNLDRKKKMNKLIKLMMITAIAGLVAVQPGFTAEPPAYAERLGRLPEQRKQVQIIMKSNEGCVMMCEEMLKDKKARKIMIDTMLKNKQAVKELKRALK